MLINNFFLGFFGFRFLACIAIRYYPLTSLEAFFFSSSWLTVGSSSGPGPVRPLIAGMTLPPRGQCAVMCMS